MRRMLLLGALLVHPLIAQAAVTANVAATNDYVFRGISNSGHRPALQGGLDYTADSGVYAGTWLSNVDFNDGWQARTEVDYYAGHAGSKDAFSWDASYLPFNYPGTAKSLKYASYKYRLDFRYSLPTATVGVYYDFIRDYFGSGAAQYVEGIAIIPLPHEFNLDLRLGRQRLSNNGMLGLPDYTQRSITLQKRFGEWDARLTWQSNGLGRAECFAGQNWCGDAINLLVTRYFTLLDGK